MDILTFVDIDCHFDNIGRIDGYITGRREIGLSGGHFLVKDARKSHLFNHEIDRV